MQYIQPKRGKAKAEPINIIDVNADDLRATSNEWLKTITDKVRFPSFVSLSKLPVSIYIFNQS